MKRNEKGITLMVLIITIIVLLILATVTISSVMKKDSVMQNAQKSARETAISQAKDDVEQAVNEIVSQHLLDEGADLASLIDLKLKELAQNGSNINDITYEYNYDLEPIEGDFESKDAPLILATKQAVMQTQAVPAERMVESKGKVAAYKPEMREFIVRYKGKIALVGYLNMDSGEFNLRYIDEDEILKPIDEEIIKENLVSDHELEALERDYNEAEALERDYERVEEFCK